MHVHQTYIYPHKVFAVLPKKIARTVSKHHVSMAASQKAPKMHCFLPFCGVKKAQATGKFMTGMRLCGFIQIIPIMIFIYNDIYFGAKCENHNIIRARDRSVHLSADWKKKNNLKRLT